MVNKLITLHVKGHYQIKNLSLLNENVQSVHDLNAGVEVPPVKI
jgi:hypothetical protein